MAGDRGEWQCGLKLRDSFSQPPLPNVGEIAVIQVPCIVTLSSISLYSVVKRLLNLKLAVVQCIAYVHAVL